MGPVEEVYEREMEGQLTAAQLVLLGRGAGVKQRLAACSSGERSLVALHP